MSKSKVKENALILQDYNRSMDVAIKKALRGSDVEDGYFLEKLSKAAAIMGYALGAKKRL